MAGVVVLVWEAPGDVDMFDVPVPDILVFAGGCLGGLVGLSARVPHR